MAEYEYAASIDWSRQGARFSDNRYSRGHTWRFDGGIEVCASSSAHIVPIPMSVTAAVDPEEAFVASLSSCHMLWFLSLAATGGWIVDSYRDNAVGIMAPASDGKLAMQKVTLRPNVEFVGKRQPSNEEVNHLHRKAHDECFIARSVRTEVRCEPIHGRRDESAEPHQAWETDS